MLRAIALFLGVLAIAALTHAVRPPERQAVRGAGGPIVVPFAVDAARELVVVDASVLVCNPGTQPLVAEAFEVRANGAVLHAQALEAPLAVDPRYAEANALAERLPTDISERQRPRAFAPPEDPAFEGAELVERWRELCVLVDALQADYAAGAPRPFVEVPFRLPLDQVFAPADPPGTERTLRIAVSWRGTDGMSRRTLAEHRLRRLAPLPAAPPTLAASLGAATLHAGDLHVHSCHGEATNACAPSGNCAAESFQTSGSFSYAQLKSQFQALGLDWFTATDHSYCIDSDAEYQAIVAETAALTDATFVCAPDTELSSDEQGAQQGSDIADLLCFLGDPNNHMGAHGIDARKPGGSQGFLGFCNGFGTDALVGFASNAAAIRAEGGYPIVNHPAASSFAWNSFQGTLGIEGDQMHGVEIWNGATQSGQGGHVAQWVAWLLAGRILYGYSGSDTHDAAFAFGANHALFLGEPFTPAGLERVLKAGRVFVSNGHALVLEVEVDGIVLPMGALQALAPSQPASALEVRAHYDFGADTATITLFRGRAGDPAESVLCQSGPLTGAGVFTCSDTVAPAARTWYRAYSATASGATTAYTNPVFLLAGSCAWSPYGTGLGGANVATLASPSNPSLGSVQRVDLAGFDPAAPLSLLVFSNVALPGGVPFAGGFVLVQPPFLLTTTVPLAAGAGAFQVQVPFDRTLVGRSFHWQAAAPDGTQPAGLAFTNGLSSTICDLLQ